MNQKCITRLKAQTMHFMLHNTDWLYSSISTDDCRGFWNSCTLYLSVQHTGTYANIHPICSPFLCIRQLYKSPLDLDSAICSGVCGTETGLSPSKARRRFPALCYSLLRRVVGFPPGRRQLSEMGEKVKIKYLELKIDLRIL